VDLQLFFDTLPLKVPSPFRLDEEERAEKRKRFSDLYKIIHQRIRAKSFKEKCMMTVCTVNVNIKFTQRIS